MSREINTRKWLKESMPETSLGFTDQVMDKIKKQSKAGHLLSWEFYTLVLCFSILGGILLFFSENIPNMISLVGVSLKLPPMALQVVIFMFVVFNLNRMLVIREKTLQN